jgi:hypothetical protein
LRIVVSAERALGHGRKHAIMDIVAARPDCSRARTPEVATALERINAGLRGEGRLCVPVRPGRWGSGDSWLGIPVSWSQISTAKAIVETDFADLEVEPSQGSHFFDNLTAFGIAFLSVSRRTNVGSIDWEWLTSQSAREEAVGGAVRHIRLTAPVRVVVDGATGRGVIAVTGLDALVP